MFLFSITAKMMFAQLQQASAHERGAGTVAKVAIVFEHSSNGKILYVHMTAHTGCLVFTHYIQANTYLGYDLSNNWHRTQSILVLAGKCVFLGAFINILPKCNPR